MQTGVIFLGTSAAIPRAGRQLPSIIFTAHGSTILLDAGEGTQYSLEKYRISPLKIDAILITHLHGDHVLGLPGLIQSMAMYGRTRPLTIIGPPGIHELLSTTAKTTHWLPQYPLMIIETSPWEKIKLPNKIEVLTYPVKHRGITAYGYRVWEPPSKPKIDLNAAARLGLKPGPLLGKLQRGETIKVNEHTIIKPEDVVRPTPRCSISYTGDTSPSDSIVEASKNVDVLIHDSTFASNMAEEAHEQGHSTPLDAAWAAKKAGAHVLILTHFSARYEDPLHLVEEARRIFPYTFQAIEGLKLILRM